MHKALHKLVNDLYYDLLMTEYGSSVSSKVSGGQVVGFCYGGESMAKQIPCKIIKSTALSEPIIRSCVSDSQQSPFPRGTDPACNVKVRSKTKKNCISGQNRRLFAGYFETDDPAGLFLDYHI